MHPDSGGLFFLEERVGEGYFGQYWSGEWSLGELRIGLVSDRSAELVRTPPYSHPTAFLSRCPQVS